MTIERSTTLRRAGLNHPVLKKIGVKDGMRSAILKMPAGMAGLFEELPDFSNRLTGNFEYIHFFAKGEKDFVQTFPKASKHLKPGGMLWASWPKKGRMETDLTIKEIIRLGYGFGMVESKCISLDSNWSALKFTFPKQGKTYHNSYGQLKK